MGDRVVDCARLESVCTARYQGFESLPIRHRVDCSKPVAAVSGSKVTPLPEIRTPFDRWGELLAGCQSEAQTPEPKRKLRQSLPIRHRVDCGKPPAPVPRVKVTLLPEIRTQFDRLREALFKRRSQIRGANRKRWQSLPIRCAPPFFFALLLALASFQPLPAEIPKISSTDDSMVAAREYQAENFDAAIAALDRYDKASGATVESLDLRGCIYMEQQKFNEAKTALDRAHEIRPDVFAPRIHMGDLLLRQKKFAEARAIYKTLLQETNILISHERLKFVLLLTCLGEHNETEAKTTLESIKFPTETPAYYYSQAAWAFAHDKKSEGQNWLEKARKVYSADAMAWFARHMYDFGWLKKKPPISQVHT